MDNEERKQALYDAMDQLNYAIENISVGLRGTSLERHAEAYIIGHLRNWVDGDGTYNMGIQQYIDSLDKEDEEDEYEEED